MSHLSDYQNSTLALLNIPQWQLREPDLLSSEQVSELRRHDETPEQSKQKNDETPYELSDEVTDNSQVTEEEINIVDEIIFIGKQMPLSNDIRAVLEQYDVPLQIVDEYAHSNLRFRLAIIPATWEGRIGEEEIRYQTSLSSEQKKQLWASIVNWHQAT